MLVSMRRSGLRVDPLGVDSRQVRIEDIAFGLARINRFNGQTEYSVAQHCVAVCDRISVESWKKYALLHDAAEAYLGDIIRPVKNRIAFDGKDFDALESFTLDKILTGLGIRPPADEELMWKYVFKADDHELARERQCFFGVLDEAYPGHRPIQVLLPEQAEALFLARWEAVR